MQAQPTRKLRSVASAPRDIYQDVTDRITAALETGTVPWHKPWSADAGQPRSLDDRSYNGINAILLGLSPYADPRWGTFKTVQRHGGHVRKGERGSLVVFWKQLQVKDPDAPNGKRSIPMLRHFIVFNADQCDGLELPAIERHNDIPGIDGADAVYAGYRGRPPLRHGGGQAFYSSALDYVQMPDRETFESAESYYLTQWHELIHSTGHDRRLARADLAGMAKFGDACYSREELCAEIGSAMIAAHTGVVAPDIDQSAAYVGGWLRALRNDKKLVVSAAARAQHAADHVLGVEAGR
jgi:antirestriction protein ArdC